MRKRKRTIFLVVLLVLVGISIVIFNSKIKNIDFSNVKANIQAWVDSGKQEEELTKVEEEETVEPEKEIPKEPEKTYVNINIAPGVEVKAEYVLQEGKKQFVAVDQIQGYTFNISPSKGQMLILDSAQNMKISDTEGAIKDITKTAYISQSGSNFPKDQILANNPTYIWHSQARFIDDAKVVYVSELPYFGNAGQKKYVWIHDIASGEDKTIWALIGTNITIGDIVPDKGITITVDGVVSYLKADETVTK